MKRLPISPEEKRLFKSLEKTAMILLLMFKIYPTPLDAKTLSYEMKMDPRTANNRLDDLASDGFTLHMKGQGYVLTAQTRSLVAELFGSILIAQVETQALTSSSSTDQASATPALALSSQAQAISLEAQYVVEVENAKNVHTHTVRALKKIEEEDVFLNLKKSSSSESELKSAQNANDEFPSVLEILAVTPILFSGKSVFSGGLDVETIEPWNALAWLAQAYDRQQSGHSYNPAGMVYKNLEKCGKPEAKYCHGWQRILPDEFLEALGLVEYDCKSCVDAKFTTRAALDEHIASMHPAQPEEETEPVEYDVDSVGRFTAWIKILNDEDCPNPNPFNAYELIEVRNSVMHVHVYGTRKEEITPALIETISAIYAGHLEDETAYVEIIQHPNEKSPVNRDVDAMKDWYCEQGYKVRYA